MPTASPNRPRSEPHPTIRPQPGILDIALYVGGESRLAGHNRVLKLSSNENPFGASPAAVEAFRAAAESLHLYPDTTHARLRAAIARVHGLDAERIVCGAGSDEIIAFLCQTYAGPGLEVIHTEHGFGMYRISALAAGATPVAVKEADRRTDVDAILAACTERTALVFIANPNNPTGTMIPEAGGRAPRRRPAAAGASRPRRRLCRVRRGLRRPRPPRRRPRQRGDDPHLLEDPRPRRPAHRLGLRPRPRHRRAEPGARPVQPLDRRPRRRRGRGPRHRLHRTLPGRERPQPRLARRRARRAGVPSDPSEANFVLARFRDEAEASPPTRRSATAASSSAASPATTCPRRCASPSATPRPAPPSPRRSAPS